MEQARNSGHVRCSGAAILISLPFRRPGATTAAAHDARARAHLQMPCCCLRRPAPGRKKQKKAGRSERVLPTQHASPASLVSVSTSSSSLFKKGQSACSLAGAQHGSLADAGPGARCAETARGRRAAGAAGRGEAMADGGTWRRKPRGGQALSLPLALRPAASSAAGRPLPLASPARPPPPPPLGRGGAAQRGAGSGRRRAAQCAADERSNG